MEEKSIKASRKFRNKAEIFGLLEAHHQSGQRLLSFNGETSDKYPLTEF